MATSKLLSRTKEWVEAKSGLTFGDALNVSLFLLTVISFVVAVGGVLIAYVTLAYSITSGKEQEDATNQAASALIAVKNQLMDQKGILDESLKAAKQEDELLTQSTLKAKEMAAALRKIEEQPNAVPIVSARISCHNIDDRRPRQTEPLVAWTDEVRFGLRGVSHNGYLRLRPGEKYFCTLIVRNIGDRILDGYSLDLAFDPKSGSASFLQIGNEDSNPEPSWQDLPKDTPRKLFTGRTLGPSVRDSGEDIFFLLRLIAQSRPDDSLGEAGTLSLGIESATGRNLIPIAVSLAGPVEPEPGRDAQERK
jgi:hypothetical protein